MDQITKQELKTKVINRIKEYPDWYKLLQSFILSDDFTKIVDTLWEDVYTEQHRITPSLKDAFNFLNMPIEKIKVVIVGQDPYPSGIANGRAMCCENSTRQQPTLRYFLGGVYMEFDKFTTTLDLPLSLKYLEDQQVMLLNKALTTRLGRIGSHLQLWSPFMSYMIEALSHARKDDSLVFLLLGAKAGELDELIHENHKVFKLSHPNSCAYSGLKFWDTKQTFTQINNYLSSLDKSEITWYDLEKR